MANIHTRYPERTLLKNKLNALASTLEKQVAASDVVTREAYLREAARMISTLYKQLNKPLFKPERILPEISPDKNQFNNIFQTISDDLTVLFQEYENLEGLVLGNFNYIQSSITRLNRRIKDVSSKVGDYTLYTNDVIGDALYFKDSFTNTSRISLNSDFLNTDQCEINQVEGITTLPIDRNVQSRIDISISPTINPNSNGVKGNNQDIKAISKQDNLDIILDGNPDTWFEYERVVTTDDGVPLVLDITLNLGNPKVVNFIQVNPNNFGTQNNIVIERIETSIDGKSYINVKDEIPITGFLTEDETNIFTLAPSTSKFAGQGFYTFTPRKAKYLHFTFIQNAPILIQTISGPKYRYAIGIRDIEAHAFAYKNAGELVSIPIVPGDEIKKVVLQTGQNPAGTSQLVSIDHRLSPDGGLTWHSITPKDYQTTDISAAPKLLDFNGFLDTTIKTASPVISMLYKTVMSKNTDAFKEGALTQITGQTNELHTITSSLPAKISLQNKPLPNSVTLVDPAFGSCGKTDAKYIVALGTGKEISIQLPWKNISKDTTRNPNGDGGYTISEVDPQIVTVGGVQWKRVDRRSGSSTNDEVYEFDYTNGILKLGAGVTTSGVAVATPGLNVPIELRFTAERLTPSVTPNNHKAELNFGTNTDKSSFKLVRWDAKTYTSFVIPRKTTVVRLPVQWLTTDKVTISDTSIYVTEKGFIDGVTELSASTDYSIDRDNGIIYSKTSSSETKDTTVSFYYKPRTELTTDDWEFVTSKKGIRNAISILDSGWSTIPIKDEEVRINTKIVELGNPAIVTGTVKFTLPSGITKGSKTSPIDPFQSEVAHIDGYTEFTSNINTREKVVLTGTSPNHVLTLSVVPVNSPTSFPITFSNKTLFTTEVFTTPTADGQYQIIYASKQVKLYYSKTLPSDLGSVSYAFADPTKDSTGTYSIDYKKGRVYTYNTIPAGFGNPKISYDYTHYEASYDIARIVDPTDFTVNYINGTIAIKDKEILSNRRVSGGDTRAGIGKLYQVAYDYAVEERTDIAELEPFFSPILRDYALKILTKGNL